MTRQHPLCARVPRHVRPCLQRSRIRRSSTLATRLGTRRGVQQETATWAAHRSSSSGGSGTADGPGRGVPLLGRRAMRLRTAERGGLQVRYVTSGRPADPRPLTVRAQDPSGLHRCGRCSTGRSSSWSAWMGAAGHGCGTTA